MHSYVVEHLPAWLRATGPLGLLWWQWTALFVFIPLSLLLGIVLGRISRYLLVRVTDRTTVTWDDALVDVITPPLRWVWTLIVFRALVEPLWLTDADEHVTSTIVRTLIFFCLFWVGVRLLDNIQRTAATGEWARAKPVARALIPLAMRIAKVVLIIIGGISLLSHLGYPVAGLIAGLGIGGIAIALAAQKTVENLFGAFSIGIDQPFREGDMVQVDGQIGQVETIGLRSTRLRTSERTVVTIPNAQMAESRVESFAERDRIRLKFIAGVVYETNSEQLRKVLDGIRDVLAKHPKTFKDEIVVRFSGFGPSSLDIEVIAWFMTVDFMEFRALREEVLMSVVKVVEAAGSSFAFPTHTVVIKEKQAPASA
jgi:MscS family membrane protein